MCPCQQISVNVKGKCLTRTAKVKKPRSERAGQRGNEALTVHHRMRSQLITAQQPTQLYARPSISQRGRRLMDTDLLTLAATQQKA